MFWFPLQETWKLGIAAVQVNHEMRFHLIRKKADPPEKRCSDGGKPSSGFAPTSFCILTDSHSEAISALT